MDELIQKAEQLVEQLGALKALNAHERSAKIHAKLVVVNLIRAKAARALEARMVSLAANPPADLGKRA
jgi:hypothetical protein